LEAGTPLADLIPAEDVLIEIDNKSLTHRPDLWGHYGFAREFAAIFERPLKPLPMTT
jgi:phenylalanyl-tRNA synthetase beta chain